MSLTTITTGADYPTELASLTITRHCESGANEWRTANPEALEMPPHLVPDSIVPLSTAGEGQGVALGNYFGSLPPELQPNVCFSSPYCRTDRTAVLGVAKIPGLVVIHDDRLREVEFGIFAHLTKLGRSKKYPDEWEKRRAEGKIDHRPPGGENWHDVRARLLDFMFDKLLKLGKGDRALVVTHETMVHVFRCLLEGLDAKALARTPVPNSSLTVYTNTSGILTLDRSFWLPPGMEMTAESKAEP